MTPAQRIDAALDAVLKASGSALKYYTIPDTLEKMREAMKAVMMESYCTGSQDNFNAIQKDKK